MRLPWRPTEREGDGPARIDPEHVASGRQGKTTGQADGWQGLAVAELADDQADEKDPSIVRRVVAVDHQ